MVLNNFGIKEGKPTVKAWQKGVIQHYLNCGYSIDEALLIARREGALVSSKTISNTAMTAGREAIVDYLKGIGTVGINYMAIGTGTAAVVVGGTALSAEVSRKSVSYFVDAGTALTITTFWPSSECNYAIGEIGLFGGNGANGSANTGTMFCRAIHIYDNTSGDYDMTWDWEVTT